MAVEFSEYRCKKKYKSKRRNIPVFRLLVLCAALFSAFKFGLVNKLVDKIPLPGNESVPVVLSWDERCRSFGGTAFELKNDLVQCSWIVNDSTPLLPNAFLRYLASIKVSAVEKIHWVATRGDFEKPLLVLRDDSTLHTYFNMMQEDSSYVWVDASDGKFIVYNVLENPSTWEAYIQELSANSTPIKIEEVKGMLSAPAQPHWFEFNGRMFVLWAEFAAHEGMLNKSTDLTEESVQDGSFGRTVMREIRLAANAPSDLAFEWVDEMREVAPVPMIGGRSPDGMFLATGTNPAYLLKLP